MKNLFCFLILATASANSFSFLPEPITNTVVILYCALGTTGAIVAGFSLLEENKKIATLKDELINLQQENTSYIKKLSENNYKTKKIENDILTAKEEMDNISQEKYAIEIKLANADQNNGHTHIAELQLQLTQINRKLKEKINYTIETENKLEAEIKKHNQTLETSQNLSIKLKNMENNAAKKQRENEKKRLQNAHALYTSNQDILSLQTQLENLNSRISNANNITFTQDEMIVNLTSQRDDLTTTNNSLTSKIHSLNKINNNNLRKENAESTLANNKLQTIDEKPEDEIAELKKENAIMKKFIDDALQDRQQDKRKI